jgi:hypothetical protein
MLHDTMAFTPEGAPLGLLNVQCWARDPQQAGKKYRRHRLPMEQKESLKWEDLRPAYRGALPLIVLPFEDREKVESHRMERCPNAFAYYDPRKDRVGTVPTCAWAVFLKTEAMRGIEESHGAASQPVGECGIPERSLQAEGGR